LPLSPPVTRLLTALCFSAAAAAAVPPHQAGLDSALEQIAAQHYASAAQGLEELLRQYPAEPALLYHRLTVLQTMLLDYESYPIHGRAFLETADSVIAALEACLPGLRGRDSVECLFYLGNATGSEGLVYGKLGKWLQAVRYGVRSRNMLETVIERDPEFYAAHLGVGAYNYYLGEGLKWLPFTGGRAVEGLREIRVATQAPFPYDIGAKNTLCWIMLDRGEHAGADSIAGAVLAAMPRNTIFMRIAVCAALAAEGWDSAAARGRRLVELSVGRDPVNWNDALTGYAAMVEAYAATGRIAECRQVATEALALRVPLEYRAIPYVDEHRGRIRKLLEGLDDKETRER